MAPRVETILLTVVAYALFSSTATLAQTRNCRAEYDRAVASENDSYNYAVADTKKQAWAFSVTKAIQDLKRDHDAQLKEIERRYEACVAEAREQEQAAKEEA